MTTKRRATVKLPAALSPGEEAFALAWRAIKGQPFEREYRFHHTRKWRFDFAWPAARIALEIEGGTWGRSRHTSATGFRADCEKYNAAALMGEWCVVRIAPDMIEVPLLQDLKQEIRRREMKAPVVR